MEPVLTRAILPIHPMKISIIRVQQHIIHLFLMDQIWKVVIVLRPVYLLIQWLVNKQCFSLRLQQQLLSIMIIKIFLSCAIFSLHHPHHLVMVQQRNEGETLFLHQSIDWQTNFFSVHGQHRNHLQIHWKAMKVESIVVVSVAKSMLDQVL